MKGFGQWVQLSAWPECPFVDLEGLHPQIRTLNWSDSVSPLDLPDFETQARRLRYQSLGNACRETGINFLLLAHHNDDQAETVLMRLASGEKGLGLKGMLAQAPIPECWGIHGVHMSGSRDTATFRLSKLEKKDPAGPKAEELRRLLARPDPFEGGGVFVLRPLLSFSKDRLIETCRTQALAWEEDKTNEDTWRTPRNSVRALLRSDKLPQALLKDSMLQLSKRIYDYFHYQRDLVRAIVRRCELLVFDVRCGGLVVRLPNRMTDDRKTQSPLRRKKVRLTALSLLKFLVSSVTPQEEVSVQSLEQAMVSVFPDLEHRRDPCRQTRQPTTFTTSGVQFQRLPYPVAAPRSEPDPAIYGQWQDLDPFFVWKLTRQPFSKSPPSLTVQPSATLDYSVEGNSSSWSAWQLWDGRYWIRLLNRSRLPLIVRSFQESDLQQLRSTLSRRRYEEFHSFLHLTVPGKMRWTLLAVAEIEDESLPMGRLVALPTLGRAGTFNTRKRSDTNRVEWQIRYKYVQLGYWISDDGSSRIYRNNDLITSWED